MGNRKRRNLAKAMARLHPKAAPLQSSGGAPDETPLDIAGAIGMACSSSPGKRLAVAVLALRWWPGLHEGVAVTVARKKIHHHESRVGRTTVKAWEEKVAVERPSATEARRAVNRILADRLGARIRAIVGRATPELARNMGFTPDLQRRVLCPLFLARWADTVIAEFQHPNHCQTCTPWGRAGEVPAMVEEGGKVVSVEWRTCDACAGAGVAPWSSKRRARGLRISEHTMRNSLKPLHEGALALLRELEYRGARAVSACLRE